MTQAAVRTDPYPTRDVPSPTLTPRRDPVVWGGPREDGLDADRLARFDRDGFLFLPSFFDDGEVARLGAELDRTLAAAEPSRDDVIVEPRSAQVRSVFAVHESVPLFARLARHPRLLAMAESIVGSPVYVHQSRVNFKPAFGGDGFAWHSDFETWHAEDGMPRMRAVSCSVLLTENTSWNGSLLVMPGSHRTYVSCVGSTPDDHFRRSLRAQEIGVPDGDSLRALYAARGIEVMAGPPGSVLLFDCNLMHGSASNISPLARSNVFLVYNSVENACQAPFAAPARRPRFVASREFAPLVAATGAL